MNKMKYLFLSLFLILSTLCVSQTPINPENALDNIESIISPDTTITARTVSVFICPDDLSNAEVLNARMMLATNYLISKVSEWFPDAKSVSIESFSKESVRESENVRLIYYSLLKRNIVVFVRADELNEYGELTLDIYYKLKVIK